MQIIDAETVARTLSMAACMDLMAATQAAISRGEARLPQRLMLPVGGGRGHFGAMPGELPQSALFGAKLVGLFPGNPAQGRPAVQGQILLFDNQDGTPLALVEAASVTAIRTAAASGAATRALAREDAHVLALLGCGAQAETHLQAMLEARPVDEVRVWGRNLNKAQAFAARQGARCGIPIQALPGAREAVAGADLICTVTGASEPILQGEWLSLGAHLNLVGAHSPTTREADAEAIGRARVFTEVTEFALAEAGDLLLAMQEGKFSKEGIVGEIGAVLEGRVAGRLGRDDITLYKNLGNTAQDLAAAHYVCSQVRGGSP